MKVLLDTNFWIYVAKYRLFDKLKEMRVDLVLIEPVVNELEGLSRSGKEKIDASIALEMIRKWNIQSIQMKEKTTDQAIFKFAKNNPEIRVATMDKALSDMLKNEGIKIIKIRQKRDFLM